MKDNAFYLGEVTLNSDILVKNSGNIIISDKKDNFLESWNNGLDK